MKTKSYTRSPEGEARRLEALRSPEVRERISKGLKGKTPKNFTDIQRKGWEASRKEVLTYVGIHAWVRRNWGSASHCEQCGKKKLDGHKIGWANLDHHYSRGREDWQMLCQRCHAAYDRDHLGVSFAPKTATRSPQHRQAISDGLRAFWAKRKQITVES